MKITPRSLRRWSGFALAALACAALLSPAQAQWKWRDSRGQITVSDTPPPRDIAAKDILQQPEVAVRKPAAAALPASAASTAAAAPAAKPAADPELEARKRKAEQEQAAKAKAEEQKNVAIRQENCRRAREQLATLDSGARIAQVKADGERVIMDDTARAKEAQRARSVIASDCR